MTSDERKRRMCVSAGQTRCCCGGAEGIRTPDLLIANETRYQLRHSPSAPYGARTKLSPAPARFRIGRRPVHLVRCARD
jgi:hypothetical protein